MAAPEPRPKPALTKPHSPNPVQPDQLSATNENSVQPQTRPNIGSAARGSSNAATGGNLGRDNASMNSMDNEEVADNPESNRFVFFNVMPSWLVSLIAHVLLILILAFLILPGKPAEVSFQVSQSEGEQLESLDVNFDALDLSDSQMAPSELDQTNDVPKLNDVQPQLVELTPTPQVTDLFSTTMSSDVAAEAGTVTGIKGGETGSRTGDSKSRMVKKYGGTPESEEAVTLALQWLEKHQLPDGSWSFEHTIGPGERSKKNPGSLIDCRLGATGLALLPFLGNGQTHKEGQYQEVVRKGLEFLLKNGKAESGGLSFWEEGGTIYSHGICSIVLCEAFAMTNDADLRKAAQATIQYIEYYQDPRLGGWQYEPRNGSDTSAVGWQIMALKSAWKSGLEVNPRTLKMASKFLDSVSTRKGAYYGYMDPPPDKITRSYRGKTAVGLLSRMYLGWEKDRPAIVEGVEWLKELGPSPETADERRENSVNMYYNYYATQLMFQFGGDTWEKWNGEMRDFLVQSQDKNGAERGSWFYPAGELGVDRGGRLYATALAALTLEVYYRYLPIYGDQSLIEAFPID